MRRDRPWRVRKRMEWKMRRARLWRVREKEDGVEDEEG